MPWSAPAHPLLAPLSTAAKSAHEECREGVGRGGLWGGMRTSPPQEPLIPGLHPTWPGPSRSCTPFLLPSAPHASAAAHLQHVVQQGDAALLGLGLREPEQGVQLEAIRVPRVAALEGEGA